MGRSKESGGSKRRGEQLDISGDGGRNAAECARDYRVRGTGELGSEGD